MKEKGEVTMKRLAAIQAKTVWKIILVLVWGAIGLIALLALLKGTQGVARDVELTTLVASILTLIAGFKAGQYRTIILRSWIAVIILGYFTYILVGLWLIFSSFLPWGPREGEVVVLLCILGLVMVALGLYTSLFLYGLDFPKKK